MVTTASVQPLLTPEQVENLFVAPVLADSIAGRICTIIRTGSHWVTVPRMVTGPSAAWVSELEEIPVSDATFDSLTITPSKVAGLVPMSNEVEEDTYGEAVELVGQRLTADTVRAIDTALLTAVAAPAPQGLESLTGANAPTVMNSGPNVFETFDAFVAVVTTADDRGAPISGWIMHPDTRTKLATIKAANGSNGYLLTGTDAATPSYRVIEGRPVYTSSAVSPDVVWAVPSNRALMVVRNDVEVDVSHDALWSRDGISIRSKMRVGFGFTDPSAIVKITTTAP